MKCPKCQFENREGASFCLECGEKLELECPQCGKTLPRLAKFCDKCGHGLEGVVEVEKAVPETEGERKHVTVLFSDLSGYTAMSERLDPEEVKEITSRIFDQVSKIVSKYEGFVEKFVGDAVMALFGVPKAHEDDPIRAIRAAREIHERVDAMSHEVEEKIGQPISMHSGINTGLVVTGEVEMEKGTHGVVGDTINFASRLSRLAKPSEILVGAETYRQAEGYFDFEVLEPTVVKGKADPAQVYKVLSVKDKPVTLHRLSGLRADLIGRRAELTELQEAVETLQEGKGRIFSICGDAGTGKSRLVEEFKATLDLNEIQWLEGHAYPHARNIPYFPLTDLLGRAFEIEEADPSEKVKDKVESAIEGLLGKTDDIVPYVGSLYGLNYTEVEEIRPEFWKSRLGDSVQAILSALAERAPTVFCLEDLQWADHSFVELLRNALLNIRQPAIVLCVYRPEFSLFTTHQLFDIRKIYNEIRLQDLSPSEAQDMMGSLLSTDVIPTDLSRFVQDRAEGNPFYLEELVNSLIESKTLIRDNGSWTITSQISAADIPSSIHGVISGRFDRLENDAKRILQEASVIGRAFPYEILKTVTELKEEIDRCLRGLEQLDLIRTRSIKPDLEYIFKHALTQEVVYNRLLKKDRKRIHERIACVIEELFHGRLSEFYETLAFHYKRGESPHKAVAYLIKSGEKSFRKYALDESHQHFKEAFEILSSEPIKTKEDQILLIDLLLKWGDTLHRRGAYSEMVDLFEVHESLAESLDDKRRIGMFYAYLGFALNGIERLRDSYQYLFRALELGEELGDHKIVGYSSARIVRSCTDLGLLDDAIVFGRKAREISRLHEEDQELFFVSLTEMGLAHYVRGESKKAHEVGKNLLEYGLSRSHPTSIAVGYFNMGLGHAAGGNFPSAIKCFQKCVKTSLDFNISYAGKTLLGYAYISVGEVQNAEKMLEEVMQFSEVFGYRGIGTAAKGLLGIVLISKGNISQGMKIIEAVLSVLLENGYKFRYAMINLMLGRVYLQMVKGTGPKRFSFLLKNVGFLIKNFPLAVKKAERHFSLAIDVAKEIGAKGALGQAYLDLGVLYGAKGKTEQAKEFINEAIKLFQRCEAEVYLKQAKEALASLE